MTVPLDPANPYEPPKAELVDAASKVDQPGALAYINGEEPSEAAAEYYAGQLHRHSVGLRPRIHVPAVILGSVWCFYRKPYRVGCVLYLCELVAGALIFFIAAALLGHTELPSSIGLLVLPFVRVPFGFLANGFYLRAASRVVDRLRARGLSGDSLLQELHRKGGVSGLGAGVGVFLNIALRAIDRLAA